MAVIALFGFTTQAYAKTKPEPQSTQSTVIVQKLTAEQAGTLEISATKPITIQAQISTQHPVAKGSASAQTPEILRGWSDEYDGIYLEWTWLSAAKHYRVYRGYALTLHEDGTVEELFAPVAEPEYPYFLDDHLPCGIGYDYYVTAVFEDGSESWPSNIAFAHTAMCVQPVTEVWWWQEPTYDWLRSDVHVVWSPAESALSYRVYLWEPGQRDIQYLGMTYDMNYRVSLQCGKRSIVFIESEAWGDTSEWTAVPIDNQCFEPVSAVPIEMPPTTVWQYHTFAPAVNAP